MVKAYPALILPVIIAVLILLPNSAHTASIHLSICASMADSFRELKEDFAARHPEINIFLNIGPSGSLARQIEQGAPADLFVSANPDWMSYLQDRELVVESTIMILARNLLVFVGSPGKVISGPDALRQLTRIAIGNPASVPAGQYALEALKNLSLYDDLKASKKLVMAKDVRQALFYADRGEVDGAFVYLSDAPLGRHTVIHFEVDPSLHSPISYPLSLTATGHHKKGAQLFYDFLGTGETAAVLKRRGFRPPR
jgi:molybdate transport system substrate-binding protein